MTRTPLTRIPAILAAGMLTLALLLVGSAPAGAITASHGKDRFSSIDYVNLGDSYSAGFGSGNLREGPLPGCTQGDGPTHVTKLDSLPRITRTVDAACAGLSASQVGEVATLISPQLAQAELVTLTLGGNDLDLAQLVLACSSFGSNSSCDKTVAANQQRLPVLSASVNQTLRTVDRATRGQIVVLGYPRLFSVTKAGNQFISLRNAKKLNRLADELNQAVRKGTRGTDADFASVTRQFEHHGFGSRSPWVYLSALQLDDPMNLHPTTAGYLRGYYPVLLQNIDWRELLRR